MTATRAPAQRTGARQDCQGKDREDTIFVSIAAYRDPELLPTIEDCLAKARWPERLRFGICWQHGPEEPPLECFGDPRFRLVDVDWRESRGACWARAEVMKLWDGETWFLQLDSHHRFAQDWDARLLEQAAATGSRKPILTTYAGPFTPGDADSFTPEPMRMEFDRFTEDGLVLFRPGAIPECQELTGPVPSRFISAHFLFAPGSFVRDVPYDPELYFIGEEITLAVRAFTHGYDLFHPAEVIVWHEYTREYRTKHWDDHTADAGVEIEWTERDAPSRENARLLLTRPHSGSFGCGTERTVADYEAFAGVSFAHRRAQDYTRRHLQPPNPPVAADWADRTRDHTVRIALTPTQLAQASLEDAEFCYVGIHDDDGDEMFRADAGREEIEALLAGSPTPATFVRTFESTARPAAWAVRPFTSSHGWLDALEGALTGDGSGEWESVPVAREPAERQGSSPQIAPGVGWVQTADGYRLTHRGGSENIVTNSTGVLVLELSNGRYSISEIVDVVAEVFGLAEPPRLEVTAFLDSAVRCGLVEMRRVEEMEPA